MLSVINVTLLIILNRVLLPMNLKKNIMKNLFYYFLLAAMFSSCQSEDTLQTIDETATAAHLENDNTPIGTTNSKGGLIDSAILENRLHWFSYISAKLLRSNSNYQTLFINKLGSGNTIDATELIGDGPFFSDFNIAFRATLSHAIQFYDPEPDHEPAKPPPPPIDDPNGGESPLEIADEIIDYLVNEHCVELYFPKGLDFTNEPYTITSTAHPLTIDDENEGYRRLFNGIYIKDLLIYTQDVTVENSYLLNESNTMVIVARPEVVITGVGGPDCTYTQYSDIDFEDFL